MDDAVRLAMWLFILVFSCVFHECAHVWADWKMGDPTGKSLGRLTLNPIPHIDLFWTIILPGVMLLTGGIALGGPKPAPVNPLNFRNPRVGMMLGALAGPASNLLLAAAGLGLLWVIHAVAPDFVQAEGGQVSFNALFFYGLMIINLGLAAFNLIPVPPLDGSRVLQFLLGPSSDKMFWWIERLGFVSILFAAYYLSDYAFQPFFVSLHLVLALLFGSEYAFSLYTAFNAR